VFLVVRILTLEETVMAHHMFFVKTRPSRYFLRISNIPFVPFLFFNPLLEIGEVKYGKKSFAEDFTKTLSLTVNSSR
jgi:hypothetical protein